MAPSAPQPGEVIGGCRVERLLGHGATAAVYLAIDLRDERPVALKLLPVHAAVPGDEAGAAGRLAHANIAALRATGVDAGWHWLAFEAAPGVPLERYARAPRLLPAAEVARIGARIAEGLAHAHAAGVVHRDIKPANVIVDLPTGSVKITDFGLARTADAERTRTGVVLGSPAYLAPEQLAGAAATPAGDLYALGITLFQLLAGRLPHDGVSMGELLHRIAQQDTPDVRTLQPGVPEPLAGLVGRLTDRRPAARPASATEVAQTLARIAGTRPEPGGGPMSRP